MARINFNPQPISRLSPRGGGHHECFGANDGRKLGRTAFLKTFEAGQWLDPERPDDERDGDGDAVVEHDLHGGDPGDGRDGSHGRATVSFDTIIPSNTFEAEDYDFGGGQFVPDPQTNGYAGKSAVDGVDFSNGKRWLCLSAFAGLVHGRHGRQTAPALYWHDQS